MSEACNRFGGGALTWVNVVVRSSAVRRCGLPGQAIPLEHVQSGRGRFGEVCEDITYSASRSVAGRTWLPWRAATRRISDALGGRGDVREAVEVEEGDRASVARGSRSPVRPNWTDYGPDPWAMVSVSGAVPTRA